MKKTIVLSILVALLMPSLAVKAQSYFAAELTVAGMYTYVKMPEGTKDIKGELLKGKATPITAKQFDAIKAGEVTKAIMINGVKHVPTPKPVKMDGGYMWCSYETLNGGTAYYQCKIPKGGGDCCKMVIVLTPATPEK
jgi:hypothetical protein